ncbi:DNA-binding protein [Streptomyces mashuensis]|uniref:DNA-binding protein n=1 Tax=Streptomyces mashuensis TaxID=33904 RepID=A0A919B014_9ACTN|nr:helix-turn-helix transcriptional regulator [Streptomyces mashuensis]GHF30907.1 DNA-binding protein [Streptomyces mashuensis]
MDQRTELSEFLRSRRSRLRPEDVGLPQYGRRRVPGLRREELAQLAGVSAAYYTRLEQGRGPNVSTAVLDAIATALRLNAAERTHLLRLARPDGRASRASRAAVARPQRVRPAVRHLMDQMGTVPAYVLGRRMDILAWNRLGDALLGDVSGRPPQQRNMAWLVFLDPATRELYEEWGAKASDVVACLRMYAGRHPDDPGLAALVGELSVKSPEFRALWAAHDVLDKGYGVKRLRHPVAGALTLSYETLVLPADPDQQLITYHAEPGSPSAEALRLLASRLPGAVTGSAAGAPVPAQPGP